MRGNPGSQAQQQKFCICEKPNFLLNKKCTATLNKNRHFVYQAMSLCPVVCLRGGERGTCLGPALFGGPPWGITRI